MPCILIRQRLAPTAVTSASLDILPISASACRAQTFRIVLLRLQIGQRCHDMASGKMDSIVPPTRGHALTDMIKALHNCIAALRRPTPMVWPGLTACRAQFRVTRATCGMTTPRGVLTVRRAPTVLSGKRAAPTSATWASLTLATSVSSVVPIAMN